MIAKAKCSIMCIKYEVKIIYIYIYINIYIYIYIYIYIHLLVKSIGTIATKWRPNYSFAEIAKKSRLHEVNSIQNCAEA